MKEKVKVLKPEIFKEEFWEVIDSLPCDTVMTTLGMFMDLDRRVVHLNLPNGRKAVILCVEKSTLIEICDKANMMTDKAFAEIFDDIFFSEEEIPSRQDFIFFLNEAVLISDPVILQFVLEK